MQKLQVIGNIVRDAQVRESNGRKAINFVIAHNESYKNKEGVKVDKATYYSCTIWREASQPTEVTKYLTKGIKVFVEGSPSAEIYKTKDGQNGIDNRINVKQIELLTFADKKDSTDEKSDTKTETFTTATEGDDLPF